MERGADVCIEVSEDSKFCVSEDRGMLRDDKNERSLSLRVEVEQIREHLHQKRCLLLRDLSVKRCIYGVTLLAS